MSHFKEEKYADYIKMHDASNVLSHAKTVPLYGVGHIKIEPQSDVDHVNTKPLCGIDHIKSDPPLSGLHHVKTEPQSDIDPDKSRSLYSVAAHVKIEPPWDEVNHINTKPLCDTGHIKSEPLSVVHHVKMEPQSDMDSVENKSLYGVAARIKIEPPWDEVNHINTEPCGIGHISSEPPPSLHHVKTEPQSDMDPVKNKSLYDIAARIKIEPPWDEVNHINTEPLCNTGHIRSEPPPGLHHVKTEPVSDVDPVKNKSLYGVAARIKIEPPWDEVSHINTEPCGTGHIRSEPLPSLHHVKTESVSDVDPVKNKSLYGVAAHIKIEPLWDKVNHINTEPLCGTGHIRSKSPSGLLHVKTEPLSDMDPVKDKSLCGVVAHEKIVPSCDEVSHVNNGPLCDVPRVKMKKCDEYVEYVMNNSLKAAKEVTGDLDGSDLFRLFQPGSNTDLSNMLKAARQIDNLYRSLDNASHSDMLKSNSSSEYLLLDSVNKGSSTKVHQEPTRENLLSNIKNGLPLPIQDPKNTLPVRGFQKSAFGAFEYGTFKARNYIKPEGQFDDCGSNVSVSKTFKQKKQDEHIQSSKSGKEIVNRTLFVEKNINKYECKVCGKCFTKRRHIYQHLRLHQQAFKCDICDKCFKKSSHLNKHRAVHESEHICRVCKKQFPDKATLTKHVLKRSFKCDICNYVFHSKVELAKHSPVHKVHKCIICNECFTGKENLEKHILEIHKSGEKYKCMVCGKCYRKDYLAEHMLFHTGYKPYHCEICNKKFHNKKAVYCHMKTHEGKLQCVICGKFRKKESIDSHIMKFHNEAKKYECDSCQKCFSHKYHLQLHLKFSKKCNQFALEIVKKVEQKAV